jgi:hypothetical protein
LASNYTLGASPAGAPVGTGIYLNKAGELGAAGTTELIAVLSGVQPTAVNLNSRSFVFV